MREFCYCDMERVFAPDVCIDRTGARDCWRAVPYEDTEGEGVMLAAVGNAFPPDLSFDPQLTGWYKIYVKTPAFFNARLCIKLSRDRAYRRIFRTKGSDVHMEESFWKCADMTGQSIEITRRLSGDDTHSYLAGLRFVAMSEEEIRAYRAEDARHKRLYMTDDIHNLLFRGMIDEQDDWYGVLTPYEHTDTEWISIEQIKLFTQGDCPDRFAFLRKGDELVQRSLSKWNMDRILGDLVQEGQRQGFRISLSLRMAAWGMTYPWDHCYFDVPFYQKNPQWRCVDRDGAEVSAMSYAYREVQDFMIDEFVNMAKSGCDAVVPIFHRGLPWFLFEQPIREEFARRYAEDCRLLPQGEPRLNGLYCEIMTGFMRRLRAALDAATGKNRTAIHVRVHHTLPDCRYVGLDVEQWCREGLVDTVIPYPVSMREKYGEKSFDGERLDVEAHAAYLNGSSEFPTDYRGDYEFTVMEDAAPQTQSERVKEWMALTERYGVKVYFDMMPRLMGAEEYVKRARELYEAGVENLALWDSYYRSEHLGQWGTAAQLGHKECLAESKEYRRIRILRIADMAVRRFKPSWGG